MNHVFDRDENTMPGLVLDNVMYSKNTRMIKEHA